MRAGLSPVQAAEMVVLRIAQWYPNYVGALVAVNPQGQHGAAAHGWHFQYSVQGDLHRDVHVIDVEPLDVARM